MATQPPGIGCATAGKPGIGRAAAGKERAARPTILTKGINVVNRDPEQGAGCKAPEDPGVVPSDQDDCGALFACENGGQRGREGKGKQLE